MDSKTGLRQSYATTVRWRKVGVSMCIREPVESGLARGGNNKLILASVGVIVNLIGPNSTIRNI
jgi:hypothetical protein